MKIDLDVLSFSNKNKLPVILQESEAESGLACMTMIANYYGNNIDLNYVRARHLISSRGTSVNKLMGMAESLNFSVRSVHATTNKIKRLQTPCILSWGDNHFVVLSKVKHKKVIIHEPSSGMQELSLEEADKHFGGVAIELLPTTQFEKSEKPEEVKLSSFWSKIMGLRGSLIKIFLLSITLQIIGIATPFYMQFVVDDVLVSRDLELLTILSIGFAMLMLVEIINIGVRTLILAVMGNQLTLQLNANVIQHLFKLPLRYFDTRHIGDVMSRIDSLRTIRTVLTTTLIESLVDGLMIIGLLAVMFFYSEKLTFIVIGVTLAYIAVRYMSYGPFKKTKRKLILAKANQDSNLIESVRGMQTVKLYNQETDRLDQYTNFNVQACNQEMTASRLNLLFNLSDKLLASIEQVAVIYISATLVIDGELSVGMIFAFLSYKGQFRQKAVNLVNSFVSYKVMSLDLERLADIALAEQEKDQVYLDPNFRVNGDIAIKNVSFRYSEEEDYVLDDVNLTINKGESIAIIGKSGCGKSTLVKVLLGLLPPSSGGVYVDNKEIHAIGLKNYRSNLGCVMQNEMLMAGTIFQNISFFAADADIKLVEECAKKASIHEDILAMPMGYQSLIGDMGNSLSGGQRQRIVLARALYRQPRILVLDEATSALDTTTEKSVIASLKRLEMTRVFVAHRPETIRSADRILRVVKGKVSDVTEEVLGKKQNNASPVAESA